MTGQQVIIKLKTGKSDLSGGMTEWLNHIVGSAAFRSARPLFPGDPDEEMASLYIAQSDATNLPDLITMLNKHGDIDYAHLPEERKGQ